MKFSLMTYSMMPLLIEKKISFEDIVKFAAKEGFQAIDLFMWDLVRPIDDTKEVLNKYNLCVSSVNVFFDFATSNRDAYIDNINRAETAIDKSIELGSPYVMVIPALEESIDGDEDRERAVNNIISGLKELVEYIKDKDIEIGIEDYPNLNIPLCSIAEIRRILNEVKGLKFTFDDGNMILRGDEPLEALDVLHKDVVNVHLKEWIINEDGNGTKCVDGTYFEGGVHGRGIINHKEVLRKLHNNKFKGYMSLEFEGKEDVLKGIKEGKEYLQGIVEEISKNQER